MPKFLDVTDRLAAAEYLGVQAVSVKSYGAVGDGVADDRAAIHAARDAAGEGGTVWFPPGTYRVEMQDNTAPGYVSRAGGLRANVAGQTWLLGNAELVLTGDQDEHFITITAPNVSIVGGTLDMSDIPGDYFYSGAIAVLSGTIWDYLWGTYGTGAAGAVIRDVTIQDAASVGVWAINTSSVTVTGCTMLNCYQAGIAVTTGGSVTDGIDDIVIQGNRIETDAVAQASCIGVGANDQPDDNFDNSLLRIRQVRISNNVCVQPRGFAPGGIDPGCIEMFNVENCVVDGNTTDGGAFGITTGFIRRGVISNNTCAGFHRYGLEVSGGLEAVAVVGNVVNSDGAAGPFDAVTGAYDPAGALKQVTGGIISAGPKSFTDYTIANNTITGFTTAARVGGISLVNTSHPSAGGTFTNVSITGNTITAGGGTAQFHPIAVGGPSTNLTVSGNVFDGSSRTPSNGVDLLAVAHSGLSITGNSFSNLDNAASLVGTLTDVRFTGNLLRNCAGITGAGIPTATRLISDVTAPLTSTATAAGTTTLTIDSTEVQRFTGSTTQTVVLPTTGVIAGRRFTIINSSTGAVTVQSSNTNAVTVLAPGTASSYFALQAAPTTRDHWQATAPQSGNSFTGVSTVLDRIVDSSGNRLAEFLPVASAVNRWRFTNSTGTNPLDMRAVGDGAAIAADIYCKGASAVRLRSDPNGIGFATFPVASGVNYLAAYSGTTGQPAELRAAGETNVGIDIRPAGNAGVRMFSTLTDTTGIRNAVAITHTVNQSSTAGYTMLLINPTETGTGSGTKRLIDAQTGGTSRFTIDNTGNAFVAGTLDLGNASDTTISRVSAGVIAVEGNTVSTRLTNTATLDFGSVTAQSFADLTITVTGAATGDAVALGTPTAAITAGIAFTAWVSATNTVTVRAHNYTAGALDPASGTFRATIIR